MTPLLPLLANALALLPLAPLTVAKHVVCSWRPGIATPDKYGFNRFCSATSYTTTTHDKTTAEFKCKHLFEGNTVKPATWNVLGDGILEFASPCGMGGWFAEGEHAWCPDSSFAMCTDETHGDECWYMDKRDDCEWPTKFTVDTLPTSVELWYRRK
ncbi:hypothetical protein BDZ90DRAFT_261436 [Jaminaea rosea]|uniref:Uncharacterized protein n=1 Tax=Jaminaea rosea TaxID=1569628 RepID=A0A316UMZ8_9BASI|nr:hypothetical protein BDZ90DRAFT_261436 [Jaminaea rosea]PWN26636.1 hypothetical protein BDZ90DRAFT_261436 [Jaminaea rosea]